nr:hypothetical protein [uncultured Cellulosilyticum sp.]
MKIRIIFWESRPLTLNCLNIIQDVGIKHYYEKVAADLYEYIPINKSSIHLLDKEISYKWDKIILCLTDEMCPEEIKLMEDVQEKWPELLNICYIPGMKAEEIVHMLPLFLSMPKKTHQKEDFYALQGSTVIMGHEKIEEGFGKLVQRIFQKWQYVSSLNYVKINLYSWQEMGLVALSEIEDIFSDYIGERARLEVAWYKSQKENNEMYFLIEGNQMSQ